MAMRVRPNPPHSHSYWLQCHWLEPEVPPVNVAVAPPEGRAVARGVAPGMVVAAPEDIAVAAAVPVG